VACIVYRKSGSHWHRAFSSFKSSMHAAKKCLRPREMRHVLWHAGLLAPTMTSQMITGWTSMLRQRMKTRTMMMRRMCAAAQVAGANTSHPDMLLRPCLQLNTAAAKAQRMQSIRQQGPVAGPHQKTKKAEMSVKSMKIKKVQALEIRRCAENASLESECCHGARGVASHQDLHGG
jgi:hypothetical protein